MLAHTHTMQMACFSQGYHLQLKSVIVLKMSCNNQGDKTVICHTSANIFIHMAAAQMAVKTDFHLNATHFYTFYHQETKKKFF